MSYDDWRLAANESPCDYIDCNECPAPCRSIISITNPDGSIEYTQDPNFEDDEWVKETTKDM